MYTDDVIMYITSPETSLPALKETIKEYSELSGYKLNETTCELITNGREWTQTAKNNFKLKWNQNKINIWEFLFTRTWTKCMKLIITL